MDTIDRENDAATPAAKAAPRQEKIPRARPVKEKIDHAALSRELMARFPKIRAALAK
jgi:hypothetical protein